MSTYAVVGGAGASSLALVDKLKAKGHEVYVVDTDTVALQALREGIPVAVKDVPSGRKLTIDDDHLIDSEHVGSVPQPDAVFVTAPNYGYNEKVTGRVSALRFAEAI